MLETSKNVESALAIQSLQKRLTRLERSASALRALLRQRLGDDGILDLIEALDSVGAGPAVLLEAPPVTDDGADDTDADSFRHTSSISGKQPAIHPHPSSRAGNIKTGNVSTKYERELENALYYS